MRAFIHNHSTQIHTAGHTDQNKRLALTQNWTAPTGNILFSFLAEQNEGLLEVNTHTEVQLGSTSSRAYACGLFTSCSGPFSPVAGTRIYKPPRLEPHSRYLDLSHCTHRGMHTHTRTNVNRSLIWLLGPVVSSAVALVLLGDNSSRRLSFRGRYDSQGNYPAH